MDKIIKTNLHPDGDKETVLYPKTSVDQIEGFAEEVSKLVPEGKVGPQGPAGPQGPQGPKGNGIVSITTIKYSDEGNGYTKTDINLDTDEETIPFAVYAKNGESTIHYKKYMQMSFTAANGSGFIRFELEDDSAEDITSFEQLKTTIAKRMLSLLGEGNQSIVGFVATGGIRRSTENTVSNVCGIYFILNEEATTIEEAASFMTLRAECVNPESTSVMNPLIYANLSPTLVKVIGVSYITPPKQS